jgi:hypothetical protein
VAEQQSGGFALAVLTRGEGDASVPAHAKSPEIRRPSGGRRAQPDLVAAATGLAHGRRQGKCPSDALWPAMAAPVPNSSTINAVTDDGPPSWSFQAEADQTFKTVEISHSGGDGVDAALPLTASQCAKPAVSKLKLKEGHLSKGSLRSRQTSKLRKSAISLENVSRPVPRPPPAQPVPGFSELCGVPPDSAVLRGFHEPEL